MTEERTVELGLPPMSWRNQTKHGTAFTISIEAREGVSTGISAHDRARTVAVAIDPTKDGKDIVSPGHVFPLTAREGGVLVRAGHTEAGVDIARMAGLIPAAVICEIMNDDGSMARLPELAAFAQFHNLKIGTISDLIAYRSANDHFIEKVLETPFELAAGSGFRLMLFRNQIDGVEHAALVKGAIDPGKPTLVRVHRVEFGADVLGGFGARAGLIERAIAEIEREGAGVLVLIRDLAPDGLSRRFLDTARAPDEAARSIGIGAQIVQATGARRIIILAEAAPRLVGVEGYGLKIEGWRGFST